MLRCWGLCDGPLPRPQRVSGHQWYRSSHDNSRPQAWDPHTQGLLLLAAWAGDHRIRLPLLMADKHCPPASSSHTSPLTSASPKVQGICALSSRPEATPTLLLFSHSVVSDSATPRTAAHQASLSFTISRSVLKLMFIESVMPSNHLILCRPLLLLPSMFPSKSRSLPMS